MVTNESKLMTDIAIKYLRQHWFVNASSGNSGVCLACRSVEGLQVSQRVMNPVIIKVFKGVRLELHEATCNNDIRASEGRHRNHFHKVSKKKPPAIATIHLETRCLDIPKSRYAAITISARQTPEAEKKSQRPLGDTQAKLVAAATPPPAA